MTMIDDELRRAALAWIEDDPEAREEIEKLLAQEAVEELRERFAGPLRFGTAGLRGLIGAGPARMNRAVVARATAGLCAWVNAQIPDAGKRGICIGFDGRRMSKQFADDAASIVAAAGIRALVFEDLVPTPVLAFAVTDQRAAAGIMITASHNPPAYNGYKVYWENGAQIIPPHDEGIARAIDAIGSVHSIRRIELGSAREQKLVVSIGAEVERRYLDGVLALRIHPEAPKDIAIAYTALHGVGDRFVRAAFADAGFTKLHSVPEQALPDPAFPTVEFPNPEEKGAMDLVLALAERERASLVLANDPDADRLAVAVRGKDNKIVSLTGNEIGCVLAHYVLDQGKKAPNRLVLSSIVSSPMLGAIAKAHGARWEETLTGFKWIANRAIELQQRESAAFVLGFEEALGYTVGTLVRDKDGVGAALVMADMAAWCAARGRTVLDELEDAYRRYGLFMSRQVSVTLPGLDGAHRIASQMNAVRKSPPSRVGAFDVIAVQDLSNGTRTPRSGSSTKLSLPTSDVLMLELDGGHRIMLRPSGTEPKIKYYFDCRIDIEKNEAIAAAKERGVSFIDGLVDGFRSVVGTG